MSTNHPVIKWTGSKRYLANDIVNYFPKEIDTYYEPCVGGGSIIRQLLESDIKVKRYICSDINSYLINLWKLIKDNPKELIASYTQMWNEMNKEDDVQFRKNYYLQVRERFNNGHNATDFFFLSRTATNGLIRFNSKGEFNSS
jgi:DNA adenine methylase